MNVQNITVIVGSLVLLSAAGAGGYYVGVSIQPAPTDVVEAVAPALLVPTHAEATAAWNVQRLNDPLGYNEGQKPNHTVALGDCAPSNIMPGVMCMTTIQKKPTVEPFNRNVNFARNAEGTWVATPM